MEKERHRMTVYQRIMKYADRSQGMRLSAFEVFELSMDDPIMARAALDDGEDEGADPT